MGPPLRSKPPLITPSASPQPPRLSSRLPDHASPSKKQRRTFHEFASSSKSRTQTPIPDIQKEREASTLRLLDVWASLAERYSRHMDDDDLVDIRTGEIIRDNGILRNAPTLQFGTLAAPVDEVNEVEDEDDEYDFDELDAFAETIDTDEEAKSELDTRGPIVPPAPSLDQAYADDLREFLEAEKIRKEQCGTDVDEDSEDQQHIRDDSEDNADDVVEFGDVRAMERRPVCIDDKIRGLGSPPRDDGGKEDGLKPISGQGTSAEPIVVTSDDELDFWKADNSNAIRVVHKDRLGVIDGDLEFLGSVTPFSCQKLPTTQCKNARTPKPRQLHTPPRSQSSSKPSVSPLTTEHSDAPAHPNFVSDSDFSGDDSSPSSYHRKRALLKHRKPTSPQLSKSMAHSSAKIFRRDHSLHTTSDRGDDLEISPVTSPTKGPTKPKQRAVVLLTPRKALKQLAKHGDSHISGPDRNDGPHGDSPEVFSPRRFSSRKGKAKERDDVVATTPGKHSTGRKVKIPLHTRLYVTGTELEESADKPPSLTQIPKREVSPKRLGKHPHPLSLKRKRNSYSTVDVSEFTMESPKRHMASGSLSTSPSLQNRSTSANHSPSTKWHSRESRTDSDSEYDEPISEQSQRVPSKRSASYVETQIPPPPHSPYAYATANHQNHVANMFTPIPDPRAQLIIAQAVQQLSALVTGIWQPSAPHYLEGSSPRTPQRRSMSVQPLGSLHTPSHPHINPFLYDPAFSGASFPPESPEPEHYTTASQRSLVSRSHSRVRKVTFQLNDEESDTQEVSASDAHRTPSNRRTMNAGALSKTNSERDDHGSLESARRIRGQTPGPSSSFHRETLK